MKRNTKLALLVAAFALFFLAVRWRNDHRYTVRNESNHTIVLLTVEIGGKTLQFENLKAGANVTAPFEFEQESNIRVYCRFEDGTELDKYVGYVVWEESHQRVEIVLQPDLNLNSNK